MDIMDQTIVLDCQTKNDTVSCESCVVYKLCKNTKKVGDKKGSALEIGVIVSIESNETSIVS